MSVSERAQKQSPGSGSPKRTAACTVRKCINPSPLNVYISTSKARHTESVHSLPLHSTFHITFITLHHIRSGHFACFFSSLFSSFLPFMDFWQRSFTLTTAKWWEHGMNTNKKDTVWKRDTEETLLMHKDEDWGHGRENIPETPSSHGCIVKNWIQCCWRAVHSYGSCAVVHETYKDRASAVDTLLLFWCSVS